MNEFGYCFAGVDDFRIYNRELTTDEITSIYNSGSGTEENTVSTDSAVDMTGLSSTTSLNTYQSNTSKETYYATASVN